MEGRIIPPTTYRKKHLAGLLRKPLAILLTGLQGCLFLCMSCGTEAPPMGNAVYNRDSLPVMITYGVSKLISDSGIVKYKIVSEEWQVFDRTKPQRQVFPKGIFLEQYNQQFHVIMHITADTAYCYNQNLWELRGRVFARNTENGTTFSSEELYWNMQNHWMYSNKPMHLVTPDRDLHGNRFESNEDLTQYKVWKTSGYVPVPQEKTETTSGADSIAADTVAQRPLPDSSRRSTPKPGE